MKSDNLRNKQGFVKTQSLHTVCPEKAVNSLYEVNTGTFQQDYVPSKSTATLLPISGNLTTNEQGCIPVFEIDWPLLPRVTKEMTVPTLAFTFKKLKKRVRPGPSRSVGRLQSWFLKVKVLKE